MLNALISLKVCTYVNLCCYRRFVIQLNKSVRKKSAISTALLFLKNHYTVCGNSMIPHLPGLHLSSFLSFFSNLLENFQLTLGPSIDSCTTILYSIVSLRFQEHNSTCQNMWLVVAWLCDLTKNDLNVSCSGILQIWTHQCSKRRICSENSWFFPIRLSILLKYFTHIWGKFNTFLMVHGNGNLEQQSCEAVAASRRLRHSLATNEKCSSRWRRSGAF